MSVSFDPIMPPAAPPIVDPIPDPDHFPDRSRHPMQRPMTTVPKAYTPSMDCLHHMEHRLSLSPHSSLKKFQPMTIRHGSCKCGKVHYQVEGDPVRIGLCHCTDCGRRAALPSLTSPSGSPVASRPPDQRSLTAADTSVRPAVRACFRMGTKRRR